MRCSGETSSSSMIKGDLAAVAVTFGAILGKTSQLQLLIAAFIEVIFYSTNLAIGTRLLQAVDSGSSISIYVHVFGAFFFFLRTISQILLLTRYSMFLLLLSHGSNHTLHFFTLSLAAHMGTKPLLYKL